MANQRSDQRVPVWFLDQHSTSGRREGSDSAALAPASLSLLRCPWARFISPSCSSAAAQQPTDKTMLLLGSLQTWKKSVFHVHKWRSVNPTVKYSHTQTGSEYPTQQYSPVRRVLIVCVWTETHRQFHLPNPINNALWNHWLLCSRDGFLCDCLIVLTPPAGPKTLLPHREQPRHQQPCPTYSPTLSPATTHWS